MTPLLFFVFFCVINICLALIESSLFQSSWGGLPPPPNPPLFVGLFAPN